ncbi:MAG: hypothetical protein QOC97_852 [Chloroflexota bacterium]|jgi:hypothetical protein|nr:hypothetical protein [Chloroflexota bacterium]
MFTMAVGHSDDVDRADAIASVIEQCRTALEGVKPHAGILFSAFDSFDPSIVAAVRDAFPGVSVMGSTSAAEMSSANGFLEDSITLALFASDTVDVTTGLGSGLAEDVGAACRAAASQAVAATKRDPKVCVVLTETFVVDPQRTLEAMADALPAGVVVVGGTSARRDFVTVTPTRQFRDGVVVSDGVAVLLFSGPIAFASSVGRGWGFVGATGKVTASSYGAIHEIDGRPAVDFLARYLDVTGRATFGNMLAVVESESEGSYLRAILDAEAGSSSVAVGGSIPVGSIVQLTTSDTDDLLAGTKDALTQVRDAFPAGATPEAALIFSCAVRKFLLGSRTKDEAEVARSVLGPSIPIAGTYCYGEIAPVQGAVASRYHNETFVTLLLGT